MTISDDYFRALVSGERRGLWPGLMRGGLGVLSFPYDWATWLRNRAYDFGPLAVQRAAVPVISIGNLTLGGTGKTPCVEYVAQFFHERQVRVAILSRGYRRARSVSDGRPDSNDEALVLDENLPGIPHLQGHDRCALAADAVARFDSEVLILDDGFQHRRLARDLDIVLIDATQPWGYGHVFPRGLLREAPGGLRRADLIVLTRCNVVSDDERRQLRQTIGSLAPGVPVAEAAHRARGLVNGPRRGALGRLRQVPVIAFCGIGNPEGFRRTLENLGLQLAGFRSFPDHHAYTASDVEELSAWAANQAKDCVIVTTQKDLVKLRPPGELEAPRPALGGKTLWALRIGLHFETGQEMLDRKLGSVVNHCGAQARTPILERAG